MVVSLVFVVFFVCCLTCSSVQLKNWQIAKGIDIVAASDNSNNHGGTYSSGTSSDYMYNTNVPLSNLPLQHQQALLQQLQQMQQLQQQEEVFKQQALNHPVLKTVTGGAVGVLFVMLTWRSLSSYELAEQFSNPLLKFTAITPTIVIMIGNLLGIVTNIVKPKNFKNIMKSILAANIVREIVECTYNVLKIIVNHSITSSKSSLADYVPKEIYFGRLFGNMWWMLLCISFSKSRWASAPIQTGNAETDDTYESSYPSHLQYNSYGSHTGNYQQHSNNVHSGFDEE